MHSVLSFNEYVWHIKNSIMQVMLYEKRAKFKPIMKFQDGLNKIS